MQRKTNFKNNNLKTVIFLLKGTNHLFIATIIFSVLSNLASMFLPQIIRISVDNAILGQEADLPPFVMSIFNTLGGFEYIGKNLWIMACFIILISLIKIICNYFFTVFSTSASESLAENARNSIYSHIQTLPFSWHVKNKTGDIIQRATSDINTMREFITYQLTDIFRTVFILAFTAVFMFMMHVKLAIVAMFLIPFIIAYSVIYHFNIEKKFEECDEYEGKLSAVVQENLSGVRVVRAFGREAYEKENFEKHNSYFTKLWSGLSKLMAKFWSFSDLIIGIQIMLILIFGAYFCINGDLTPGKYIAFISYNATLIYPVRFLGETIAEMSKAGVSVKRIAYILNSESEKDEENSITPALNGDIDFENVCFAYDDCPETLHDINLHIKSGTTLGILGGTGSGKSTLTLLLDKIYSQTKGKITIGGYDIKNIKTSYLRENIGLVLQEPFLFSRSISENIGITLDDPSENDILKSAESACLTDTISGFSKGYDTFVGEKGVTLSGGQKQRVAIARTLIKNTPIMIFDDSLSAVDTETDEKIRNSLETHFGKATIILISHRITTLMKADKIIVMENGRITEEGTSNELLKNNGTYSKIYHIQKGDKTEINNEENLQISHS